MTFPFDEKEILRLLPPVPAPRSFALSRKQQRTIEAQHFARKINQSLLLLGSLTILFFSYLIVSLDGGNQFSLWQSEISGKKNNAPLAQVESDEMITSFKTPIMAPVRQSAETKTFVQQTFVLLTKEQLSCFFLLISLEIMVVSKLFFYFKKWLFWSQI